LGNSTRRMKPYFDTLLASVCGLLAAVSVYLSATGCEKISMVLWAVLFSGIDAVAGIVLITRRLRAHRSISTSVGAALTCIAVIISVAIWHWPLRASYSWSQNAFDSFAERVRAGQDLRMPQRVGFFKIEKALVSRDGIVCLWTMPNPAGSTGFVQCRRDHIPFNLWSVVKLDDQWQFISED
jgi:hypothetical protein